MIKTVPNNEAIAAVKALISEGHHVVLPVKGNSMLPFIIGGRESVELIPPPKAQVGDVILAWVDGSTTWFTASSASVHRAPSP